MAGGGVVGGVGGLTTVAALLPQSPPAVKELSPCVAGHSGAPYCAAGGGGIMTVGAAASARCGTEAVSEPTADAVACRGTFCTWAWCGRRWHRGQAGRCLWRREPTSIHRFVVGGYSLLSQAARSPLGACPHRAACTPHSVDAACLGRGAVRLCPCSPSPLGPPAASSWARGSAVRPLSDPTTTMGAFFVTAAAVALWARRRRYPREPHEDDFLGAVRRCCVATAPTFATGGLRGCAGPEHLGPVLSWM